MKKLVRKWEQELLNLYRQQDNLIRGNFLGNTETMNMTSEELDKNIKILNAKIEIKEKDLRELKRGVD